MDSYRDRLARMGYCPVIKDDTCSLDYLEELTKLLGRKLPSDYLRFLNECPTAGRFRGDGGVGIDNVLLGTDYGSESFTIDILFAGCSQKAYDLIAITEGRREFDDGHADDYLRIGRDVFGHSYVIDLRPTSFGQVSFLDHTDSDDEGMARLFLLADSFFAFVSLLDALPGDV